MHLDELLGPICLPSARQSHEHDQTFLVGPRSLRTSVDSALHSRHATKTDTEAVLEMQWNPSAINTTGKLTLDGGGNMVEPGQQMYVDVLVAWKPFCASRCARLLKKSVPASWPAKCHYGTIWVYRGDNPSLTHNFKRTFPPFLGKPIFVK